MLGRWFIGMLACWLVAGVALAGDSVADSVLRTIQRERERAGAPELTRDARVDLAARRHAEQLAALTREERLAWEAPIEPTLRASGLERFRQVAVHQDMARGYSSPASAFVQSWRNYTSAWETALAPDWTLCGFASVVASDGWVVLVAVLVEDLPPLETVKSIEARMFDRINEIRLGRSLGKLRRMRRMDEIARAHSVDMMTRDYFDHRAPDGAEPADRAREGGLGFAELAENIQMSRSVEDPVQVAVASWMNSPGHREAILTAEFSRTGIGAAVASDGTVYFTQLFLRPED